jgi:anti-sigma regulatory factor (Ser/Thr protein kinase)
VEALSTVSISISGPDEAGAARRTAAELARSLGFGEGDVGRVAIVATECANNLWKHASGGEMLLTGYELEGQPCVEAIALDRGPGMYDVERCFQDGYSTAGSAGSGLGAVGRLSECEVFSRPGKGTAILARLFRQGHPTRGNGPFLAGGIAVPFPGETECGDGYAFRQAGPLLLVMLADGLGHGPTAAECAGRAIEAFHQSKEETPAKLIREIHIALRGTRGAAVSVAALDPEAREIRFSGVGNVLGVMSGPGSSRNFVAMPGIVGHQMAAVREFTYPWPASSLVLLYSDGIGSHWSLDDYEGLAPSDPSLISAVIYRDRKRGRDDASVLAIRERLQA